MNTVGTAAASPAWRDGWLVGTASLLSPNCDPRPTEVTIDLVIVHSISLPPGEYGGDAVERLFMNRLDWSAHPYFEAIRGLRVSAHFFVRRNGDLQQFVSCDERAWHAGRSDWRGRGDCNDYSVGVELEGLEGEPFEAAQYERLARVVRRLGERYPIASVAGHEHVAPGRKRDPGVGFDWSKLRALAPPRLEFAA